MIGIMLQLLPSGGENTGNRVFEKLKRRKK